MATVAPLMAVLRLPESSADWLAESLRNIESARTGQSVVYRPMGAGGIPTWFAIHRGRVVSIVKAP